ARSTTSCRRASRRRTSATCARCSRRARRSSARPAHRRRAAAATRPVRAARAAHSTTSSSSVTAAWVRPSFSPTDAACHNRSMSLISPADQEKLREAFNEMTSPVRLLFFTQTLDCETCLQTRQILDELPPLSDKISIEEVNLILEGDKAKQYGVERVPAIAVVGEDESKQVRDSRIRFLGAPAGYEFISLIQAVLLVGGRPPHVTEANRARLAAVNTPLTMQVFTTPT